MDITSNLKLPYLLPNQAQKHVTVNEALRAIDAQVQINFTSRTLQTPPNGALEGERYLVPLGATGDWSGQSQNLAVFQDGQWVLHAPVKGWLAWVEDEQSLIVYDGTAWQDVSSNSAASLNPADFVGVNATADSTNRLSVNSPATLFSHEGSGHQFKINKAAIGDTASLLFQTGFSGRAEIGLIGDDSFSIKSSSDGTSFSEVLKADISNGYVGMGTDTPASRLHLSQDTDARLTITTQNGGSGGGFDIINAADNQNWRVTGSKFNFKLRDHTLGLDKLILLPGASGNAFFTNISNLGVGTSAPSTKLHVNGPVRMGQYSKTSLPSAGGSGAGSLIFVSDESTGPVLAFSDGTNWRRVNDRGIVN